MHLLQRKDASIKTSRTTMKINDNAQNNNRNSNIANKSDNSNNQVLSVPYMCLVCMYAYSSVQTRNTHGHVHLLKNKNRHFWHLTYTRYTTSIHRQLGIRRSMIVRQRGRFWAGMNFASQAVRTHTKSYMHVRDIVCMRR